MAEYNIGRATVYDLKMKENKLRQYVSQMDKECDKRRVIRNSENHRLDTAAQQRITTQWSDNKRKGTDV